MVMRLKSLAQRRENFREMVIVFVESSRADLIRCLPRGAYFFLSKSSSHLWRVGSAGGRATPVWELH